MLSDIEIAQKIKPKPIEEIASQAGILLKEIEFYGKDKAKINLAIFERLRKKRDGKLILVTTMTPTSKGEGKTTLTIGLAQALQKIGQKSFICLREPSLGPTMGIKGGAAGGGYSQILPMEDINLHFTGDMHMISAAHNLLSAMLDNHIYQGDELGIDRDRLIWKRALDMSDRALRATFDIAAASEVMAIICLAHDLMDMKKRLNRIIVAYTLGGNPVRAADFKASGAMALLLKEVIKPNLVQSIEGVPAFVHGGPFANIAHGCNSLIATKLALKLADYVITEAGFGTDLGAEKFFNIKCREGNLSPAGAVLVVTSRAWKVHGRENLAKHVENIKLFGVPLVVAINQTEGDDQLALAEITAECEKLNVKAVVSKVWREGGRGGVELAREVAAVAKPKNKFRFLYGKDEPLKNKIEKIAVNIYGAEGVNYSKEAENDLAKLENLPVCIAKTQSSLSDNPRLTGRPKGFCITIKKLRPSAGAGFVVAYAGEIMTMPGLPKHPAAENMDIDAQGNIKGLF